MATSRPTSSSRGRATQRFARDAHRAVPRGRFRKAADLDPPLTLLEEHGYLRRAYADPIGPKGGRLPRATSSTP